jgi:hypothetical protein
MDYLTFPTYLRTTIKLKSPATYLPYILESNPHPNLIRTQVLAIS